MKLVPRVSKTFLERIADPKSPFHLGYQEFSRGEITQATANVWHASIEGHNALADAAFKDLGPSLEFLGIGDSH